MKAREACLGRGDEVDHVRPPGYGARDCAERRRIVRGGGVAPHAGPDGVTLCGEPFDVATFSRTTTFIKAPSSVPSEEVAATPCSDNQSIPRPVT